MKVSVITVCFNSENEIRETIESVLKQDFTDYEYIVKDGKSQDRTISILHEYEEDFEKKGIVYRIISEKDGSIYRAMNEGIKFSNGEWLNFMNAGDTFANSGVLKNIFEKQYWEADLLYGDNYVEDEVGVDINKADVQRIGKSMPFNHQACFFKREKMIQFMYDEKYTIGADYDLIMKMYAQKNKFVYLDMIVSKYRLNGVSSTKYVATAIERQRIRNKYGYKDSTMIEKLKIFEAYLKEWMEKYAPATVLRVLKKVYKKFIKKYKAI